MTQQEFNALQDRVKKLEERTEPGCLVGCLIVLLSLLFMPVIMRAVSIAIEYWEPIVRPILERF